LTVVTVRVFTLKVMTPSLGEVQVSATSTKLVTGRPTRTEEVEARHWIERQLKWERTLGTLRGHRSDRRTAAAAA
jgi:hypothetical protein